MQTAKDRQLDPTAGDLFAASYLQLCSVSYEDPSQIPGLVEHVKPLFDGGLWRCTWGPSNDPYDANLVFVASYFAGPGGPPILAAVVVRGTDVDIQDTWGILVQSFEDMAVLVQTPPPWPSSPGALVADGTLDALATIQGLQSGGQTLLQFLSGHLGAPDNMQPLLVVTGHSLGACLTTVVAPWLKYDLAGAGVNAPIVPVTFAAPTAGNAAFASDFSAAFPYSLRYANSLDIVPRAWWDLDGLASIYNPCGLDCPEVAYLAIESYEALMDWTGVSYQQPQAGTRLLDGACAPGNPPPDWYDEALAQHHPATYLSLLGGSPTLGLLGSSAAPDVKPRIPARPRRNRRRPGAPPLRLTRLGN
jgi:triacylglycerol lipase